MDKIGTSVIFKHIGRYWMGRVTSDLPVVNAKGEEVSGERLLSVSEFYGGMGSGFTIVALASRCVSVRDVCPWCGGPLDTGDEDDCERFCGACADKPSSELKRLNLDRFLRLRKENPGWFEEVAT